MTDCKWNHVQDSEYFMNEHEGQLLDGNDKPVDAPGVLDLLPDGDDYILHVDIAWRSVGYHEDMSMYGGSDRLGWPESHEDERTLEDAVLCVMPEDGDSYYVALSKSQQEALFEHFREQIEEEELDIPDECDYFG